MSPKIAVIGANGFIGGRAVEMLHLRGMAEVRPIARSAASLARAARFDLDCRIADACDESAMRKALEGCDAAVHAVAGDPATILGSIAPVYRAAGAAGVKRLVYLSSSAVHGQAPAAGTDEATPLSDRQPIAYNNAKVKAERKLRQLRDKGSVELVILRPGIVTGPRSGWTSHFASQLLAGTAYWLDGGKGICNSLYVDNLIHAIHLALTTRGVDGHAFIVGDDETVTWADLYRPVAEALGFDLGAIAEAGTVKQGRTWLEALHALNARADVQAVMARIPKRLRKMLYAGLTPPAPPPPSPWAHPAVQMNSQARPEATLEMALLYRCAVKLSDAKARRILDYRPVVTFAEGCRRTLGWMAFAGYPLATSYLSRADNAMKG
jgi:2-alkyl-3-oxoalkanoate reductase